jgi:hypothetical protein
MSRTYRKRNKSSEFKKKSITPVSYKVSKDLTKNKSPEVKRDTSGNVIYASQYVGDEKFEYWIEYNSNKQPIHYHDTTGNEWWAKYNSKNNICNFWDTTGYEEVYNYYKNDIVIRVDSYGGSIKKIIDRERCKVTRDIFINTI